MLALGIAFFSTAMGWTGEFTPDAGALLRQAISNVRQGQGPDAVPGAPAEPAVKSGDRLAEFQFIAAKLESVYSHLQSKQKNYGFSYAALKAQYQERVRSSVSDSDYQAALRAFLGSFHDPHLWISFDSNPPPNPVESPAVVNTWTTDGILITKIARLWGDAAEIRSGLEASLKLAKGAKALIIDLRGNGGGNDSLAYDYISKLVAKEIPLGQYSIRISAEAIAKFGGQDLTPDPNRPGFSEWKKESLSPQTKESFPGPIGVLIDGGCVSSCEGTTVAFKFSGAATLYGSRTAGSSGNPVSVPLPVTKGSIMIPTWIHIMPDGNPVEDHGILPDVAVPTSQDALEVALKDIRSKISP